MKMLKKTGFLLLLVMFPLLVNAQWADAQDSVEEFKDFVTTAAPIAFLVTLLVGAVFNIKKVWGEDRDWKGFFTSLGLFVLAVAFIVAIASYLASLSFA